MLVLLPPSETKRAGGTGAPCDLSALALAELAPLRERAVEALIALSADEALAAKTLKLSPRQVGEVAVNAALRTSPTMPAIQRYTGVLFDAIPDAELLELPSVRSWLTKHVMIHSAPFGPVGALDAVPAYRLGAGISVPGIGSQKRFWAEAVTAALAATDAPFILDMRSEAYVALGPVPATVASVYVRVVARGADGTARALNHFNKHAKGALTHALAISEAEIANTGDLFAWAEDHGFEFVDRGAEVDLVVNQVVGASR